ncbi:MAG TPA: tetratricopeptide repeat protein [Pyrinomonadaceae bacterium]|nr:tetratricopeptide repeat protein [Pyrinomonadaceae bacterium]
MTLPASLLRELENPNLSVDSRAEQFCQAARALEDKGEYDDARQVLSHYWQGIGERPNVTGLQPGASGEVLLRAGVLTGIIGGKNQITDAQEKAKDLISESLAVFESCNYKKKISEAQIELALCYWRTGENDEARDFLITALSQLPIDGELKAKAVLRLAIVELEESDYDKTLSILTEYDALFQKINSQTLQGSYYGTRANVLEKVWERNTRTEYLDRALVDYAAASYHFEQAEHRIYLAGVENNLGHLYFTISRFDDAHTHLDHARRVFASLKDTNGVARVDETRACVFLKQGRLAEAERVASAAVRVQEEGGRHALLAEALITYGRALARSEKYGAALFAFRRAVDLYEQNSNSPQAAEASLAAFREIGEHLVVAERGQFLSGRALVEDKLTMEREVIKLALEQSDGRITHAARSLGMSWQALSYALSTRHKELLTVRKPVRHRKQKR